MHFSVIKRLPANQVMWKNILLVLLSTIIALLIGEGLIRIFVDEEYDYPRGLYLPDSSRGYWVAPGFCGPHRQINGDFSVNYCINDDGYRTTGAVHSVPETDVLILGDSFSFGVGVQDEETFATQLSAISGLNVTNSAISGYDVPSAINALDVAIAKGARPRVVILGVYLGNDLLLPGRLPAAERVTATEGVTVSKSGLNSNNQLKLERRLRYYVRLYGFLASRFTQFISASSLHTAANYRLSVLGLVPEEDNKIFSRLESDIARLQKRYLQRVPEGRLIILLIPTKFQVENIFQDELCQDLLICPKKDERNASIKGLNDTGKRMAIPVVDIYPVLKQASSNKKDEFYFYHNDHWNARSHKFTAKVLWQEIKKKHQKIK